MIHFNYSLKSFSAGMLLSLYCAVPVLADDTEIYTSESVTTDIKPNVLFVIDTSGSMSSNKITISQAYDSSTTYPDVCGTGKVYYSSSESAPSCNSGNYFDSAALNCDHALRAYDGAGNVIGPDGPLATEGFYQNNMAQSRTSNNNNTPGWKSISSGNSNRSKPVECEADQGIHGANSAPGTATYIKNGTTAWSSSQSITSWPGRNYTIYSSNYINYLNDTGSNRTITRFQAVKEAVESIVSVSNNINIGLMGFSGNNNGGQVLYAIEDIDTARQPFIDFVMDPSFDTNAYTPLSETYFEALHYFAGKTPPYGTAASPKSVSTSLQADGTYLSPITHECQKNHIVFLTDGDPTKDHLTTSQLQTLPGYTDFSCASNIETTVEGNQAIIEGNCLDRLASWAFTNDVANESGVAHEGEQNIITNTIGFGDGLSKYAVEMLERTAAGGGGQYYVAQNPNELVNQFTKIFAKLLEVNTSFSSPAVSVNAFNRSTHLNDLYFTLFKPTPGAHWAGNLKKYKLDFFVDVNDVDGDNDRTERLPFIADFNGNAAIDISTGFFSKSAQSFWSDIVDADQVTDGGAAGEFANRTLPRNVYTFTGTYTNNNGVFVPGAAADLTVAGNRVEKANTAITDVMLDIVGQPPAISSTPLIETLLDWASGLDVFDRYGVAGTTTDQRLGMGDPLHSQPALVQYREVAGEPDLVSYVATNDGYLHAIDADDGSEIFSFIPQELLPNLNDVMDDTTGNKVYGLDGDVVAWVDDADNDGINGSDHVYLYVGMRRGGNNIYSLDVTNRDSPKLRWVIKGGSGDYAQLGQTWSTVNVEKVKDGDTEKTVLIFGGGYDTNQDGVTVRTADTVGRAIYIADADTGALLWSAGPNGGVDTQIAEMNYSIPARIKPLDINGDGFIDRLYAADMGGQIFRFDIDNNNGSALAGSVTGGRIADLASTGEANARRFYYPPDVALIAAKGKAPYLALAITSGYRAHPNDLDIHDRIYMIKDNDIYTAPSTYPAAVTEASLYDATLNLAGGNGTDAQKAAAKVTLNATTTHGWYIQLDDENNPGSWIGEKGLSEALILDGVIIVSTFTPNNATGITSSCQPQSGDGKVFFVDVLDATPAYPADTDTREKRHISLAKGGIPPSPNVIITKGGEPTICVGTECKAADLSKGARKTNWYEVEK